MKSYYNLAQALLGLRHPMEALETAKHAYQMCLETRDSSTELLSQFILRTKQAQWQSNETARLRQLNETLANVEDLLQQQLEKELDDLEGRFARQEIGEVGRNEERLALEKEAAERRSNVREAFRNAQNDETAERVRSMMALLAEHFANAAARWYQISSLMASHLRLCTIRSLRPLVFRMREQASCDTSRPAPLTRSHASP
jgi:hypothetical protein